MKYILRRVVPVVLAFGLVGCSVTSQDTVMTTEKRTGGFLGLSTKSDIDVDTPKAFAEVQKVVIGGFKVGFNQSKKLQKKAGGMFSGGMGGNSTGLVKLDGVSPEVHQRIVNEAHEKFVQALIAQGYEVLPRETFTGNPAYAGTTEYDFPYKHDQSGLFSSYGVGTFYSPSQIGPKQPVFFGEIQGVTGGLGTSNPGIAVAKFGEQTGAHVINVTYLLDFAGAGGHAGGSFSTLGVGQVMSVDAGLLGIGSGYMSTFGNKVGKLTLGQPIGSDIAFATIENTTSSAEVGLETALNVFTAVLGGGTNQTREFVFHADPDKYALAAIDALDKANAALVSKMAELR
ncbi:hypothetical protein [Pusillimonas sp. ANT_WB101]|uniref:hypothetical protein n=1 Tax=Pusillimonas sp. ANT_WB101 TaxID=2597356 RepID=UPI0011EEF0E1|nr:hypothetical protein [Pusillimonas sp. ANT_WB101]KAA0890255.1 hypothetical protein FQ179_18240 [Pusillimonas sp. ANT_WB101]